MINIQSHQGVWQIEHLDKNKNVFKTEFLKNRITNVGLNTWANALIGNSTDIEIKRLALGTDDTAINDNDTTLGSEVFRVEDIDLEISTVGQTKSVFEITETEALAEIKEIGIFCGSTATGTTDTGTMLSRILWDIDRTSGASSIRFIRLDTFERK